MAIQSGFRFEWRGHQVAVQLEAAIEAACEETAAAMEAEAKSRARVDTGEMRDSITGTVETVPSGRQILLAIGADHGIFHELGTSRIPAQPMIRPAIDVEGPKLGQRIRAHTGRIR